MKYSQRPLPVISQPELSRNPSTEVVESPFQRAMSPLSTPAKLLQQSGGLEALLQDAAKGVYTRGEKWGVNKALRDAVGEIRKNVNNLQSPRPGLSSRTARDSEQSPTRQPLPVDSSPAELLRKIDNLQLRNKALASMLEVAVADLWSQQKEVAGEKPADDEATKAFTVAVGKVQFVQIYLEDASLPLVIEEPAMALVKTASSTTPPEHEASGSGNVPSTLEKHAQPAPATENEKSPAAESSNSTPSRSGTPVLPSVNTNLVSKPITRAIARPSLEQSSFSWMLSSGSEDKQETQPRTPTQARRSARSTFASASPFTPAPMSGSGGSAHKQDLDFLFGDPLGAGDEPERPARKGSVSRKAKDDAKGKTKAESQADFEVYRLNTMRGKGSGMNR